MAGPRIAGTFIPPERPTSCKRPMMAAATAHPRRPTCAPGSIETSGSNAFMRTRYRAIRRDCMRHKIHCERGDGSGLLLRARLVCRGRCFQCNLPRP